MNPPTDCAVQPDAACWRACLEGLACLDLDALALLRIRGADAADLLQRVSSQEVLGLEIGRSARACVLSGKGKLLALFALHRLGEEDFVAEMSRARVADTLALLDRYVFAEDVQFQALELVGRAFVGPGLGDVQVGREPSAELESHSLRLVTKDAVHLWAEAGELDAAVRDAGIAADLPRGGMAEWHALRIEAVVPLVGADADEKTLPLEVGLDDACDPDKGCYPGQEIVARIRTYGHVNRVLCKLDVPAIDELPVHGTLVFDEDIEAGRVTSCYRVPGSTSARALAMLPRALRAAGTELRIGAEDGAEATVAQ